MLNRILRLLDFGSEKRIFLKSRFVFDDNGRNAHAFQRAHRVDKVFDKASGIAVKNDGLGRHFHHIINRAKARCHINEFNVRFTLGRRITQGTNPHRIELVKFPVVFDHGFFRK